MKKRPPELLKGKETGRIDRDEAVAAILYVRAAKRAAARSAGPMSGAHPVAPGGGTAERTRRSRRGRKR